MVTRSSLSDGATFFSGAHGSVYVHTSSTGTLEAKWIGEFDDAYFGSVSHEIERRLRGALHWRLFSDLSQMSGYSSEFRAQWVHWFMSNRGRIERSVFLHRAALVRIGLAIVNVALRGQMESLTDPMAYARLCRQNQPPPVPHLNVIATA